MFEELRLVHCTITWTEIRVVYNFFGLKFSYILYFTNNKSFQFLKLFIETSIFFGDPT